MEYCKLGKTAVKVSKLCLGTMTWGEQNSENEAHQQLDLAIDHGVNFIDTAELYAIPAKAETYGKTETFIGSWLKNQDRSKLIVATKVSGPSESNKHIRGGKGYGEKGVITQAIEDSLKRLQTDYIDLYQLHWPERKTNFFGNLGYKHLSESSTTDFHAVMEELNAAVQAGKIRHVGVSNETPWGLMKYIQAANEVGLSIASVQNPYSLVNRTYEIGLSEMSIREGCGLLAYSPLAGGLLSGKYLSNSNPANARYTLWPNYFTRYSNENSKLAIEQYVKLARAHGLSPSQMALAFINQQPFLTANIIGATNTDQLKENLGSINIKLSEELMEAIEAIHTKFPNPAP